MTGSNVVAGGRKPARHHKLVQLFIGASLACVAFALVFASGYLFGTSKESRQPASAVKFHQKHQKLVPGLPGPDKETLKRREPATRRHPAPATNSRPRFVTVETGDTLWGIATSIAPHADPQVFVDRIMKLNSLDESGALEIGQRLTVPGGATGSSKDHKPGSSKDHKSPKASESSAHGVASPVSVSVPTLHLHQRLVELNVNGGTLEVPTDYDDVGWWRDGPSPGAPGSAVLVGHVDSLTGPAVFYRLSSIHIGDAIVIGRADGTKATFRVSDATLYPRQSFPSASVYRKRGRPTLTLVTCGGPYDREAGHYTGNLVVTAHLDGRKAR